MKPSTSLGTMSNVGIVNPSPLVRQAGNIRGLLRIHEVCRMNILSSCSHVKDRCRCRVTPARCVWPVRSHTPGYVNVAPMDVTGVLFSRECPIACVRRGTWVMPSGAQGVCPIGQRRRHAVQLTLSGLYLLSAPLTIPLVCCHINSFQRASSCGEAMARRRKEERRASHRITRNVKRLGRFYSRMRPRDIPARGVVPDRCHSSGSAVDARHDTTAWVRRAERAADGGVVDVSRALSASPRAPRINPTTTLLEHTLLTQGFT